MLRRSCVLCTLWCAACTSGVDVGGAQGDGSLSGTQGVATAPYLLLDLNTLTYRSVVDPGDLGETHWRTVDMLFRRIETSQGPAYLGVFETTQAQWLALGGRDTWTAISPSVVDATAIGDTLPAYNLSYQDASSVLSAWNRGKSFSLGLPSETQWVAAAGTGTWDWGTVDDRLSVRDHALVWETLGGSRGPEVVGSRMPGVTGLYDLHGNVWEWCAPGSALYGGSWRDSVQQARTENRLTLDNGRIQDDTAHALFGVRLVLRP